MTTRSAQTYWRRDKVHYPRPVLPLFISYGLKPVEIGTAAANDDWSVPAVNLRYHVRNGYVYQRTEPFGGDPPPIAGRFPALFHLWRINPPLRRRVLGFDRFIQDGGLQRAVFRWKEEWKPEAIRRLEPLRAFDRAAAELPAIADHLEACYDYFSWAWNPHYNTVMACMYVRGRWVRLCQELFDLTKFEAYELVQRSDPDVFAASNMLVSIASRARTDDTVLKALQLPHLDALEALRHTWFGRAIYEFIDRHGDRPVDTYELDPTWREMPDLVVGMVKSLMDSDYNPAAQEAAFEAYRQERLADLRARLTPQQLQEFDHWRAIAEEAYPLVDTHDYLLANVPASLVRYDALEAGRRLSATGRLEAIADSLYLYKEELLETLRSDRDVRELVRTRKEQHQQNLRRTPPDELGTPPPAPPFEVFPPAVAQALSILTEQIAEVEADMADQRHASADGSITGLPGSPGAAEGPARVVLTAADFARVQPGDVLVCPFTTPSWTVLFPKVVAVITDSGGPLSHAAIVAREYSLPAVVGTGSSTRQLEDGQQVQVDGTKGLVRISAKVEAG